MEFVKRKLTKQQLNFMYNASKNQVEEFLKKRHEKYLKSPLSIKLFGDKSKYNDKFSPEMNCAMYYVSEWGRKIPDNRILLKYGYNTLIDCAIELYSVDKGELVSNLNMLSTEATTGNKYSYYIIQPYIIENKIKHYFPKTIVKSLDNDRLDRRFTLIDEIKKYWYFDFGTDVLYVTKRLKDAKQKIKDIEYNEIDIDFMNNIDDNFHLKDDLYKNEMVIIKDGCYSYDLEKLEKYKKEYEEYEKKFQNGITNQKEYERYTKLHDIIFWDYEDFLRKSNYSDLKEYWNNFLSLCFNEKYFNKEMEK